MDPMIKNSFFTILIYWNDNRIHLGLTKKLIFFILFPPLLKEPTFWRKVTVGVLNVPSGEGGLPIRTYS